MRQRLKYVSIRVASASGAAERWARSYQHPKDGWRADPMKGGKTAKQVHDELCALGPNPSLDAVAEVIGNKSWSYLSCDSCLSDETKLAEIGEYEPKGYCLTCLTEAVTAMTEAGQ